MTPQDFCYWLQGYFDLSNNVTLTQGQVEQIKNHLKLVSYHHIDPKEPGNGQVSQAIRSVTNGTVFYRC